MLYWLSAKSGPPDHRLHRPGGRVDRHERRAPVGTGGLRGSCFGGVVRQGLQVLVEGGGDLEAAPEQRVAPLFRRRAEARVGEQAVLHLGDEEAARLQLGRAATRSGSGSLFAASASACVM